MENITAKFNAAGIEPGLRLIVRLGSQILAEYSSPEQQAVEFEFADTDGLYELEFEMTGKSDSDTVIDDQGNIIKDNTITISDLQFDDIDIDCMLHEHSRYFHNFNGHGNNIEDRFYGTMGCNGIVKFKFSCPFYIWLLENS